MWKCPKCGAEWPDGHAFCMNCGTEKPEVAPLKQKRSGFRFSSFIIGLLAAVVFFSLIFAVIKWLPSSNRETLNTSDQKEASVSASASEADKTQAPNSGNTASLIAKGLQYELGDGEKQDYVKAEQCYREAAEAGDTKAMALLGRLCLKDFCYHSARSVYHGEYIYRLDIDHKEQCLEWLRKSARADDPLGLYCLGTLYDDYMIYPYYDIEPFVNRHTLENDADIAADYYLRSAKLGCSEASEQLAEMYYWLITGEYITDEEKPEVSEMFEELAENGDPYAFVILGCLEEDRDKRDGYFENAADAALKRKEAGALIKLTNVLFEAEDYSSRDYSKVLSYLNRAVPLLSPGETVKTVELLSHGYLFHDHENKGLFEFYFSKGFDAEQCIGSCIDSIMNNGSADDLAELGVELSYLSSYEEDAKDNTFVYQYNGYSLRQLSAECLLQASERGHIGAMMELSCQLQDRGMYDSREWKSREDPARFFKVILDAAENEMYPWVCSGEPTIAWMYANGFGTEKDEKKAEYWEKLIEDYWNDYYLTHSDDYE